MTSVIEWMVFVVSSAWRYRVQPPAGPICTTNFSHTIHGDQSNACDYLVIYVIVKKRRLICLQFYFKVSPILINLGTLCN